jgi:hypothetical protein
VYGWNPKQVRERLGHNSIRTTLDRSSHLFDGHDDEVSSVTTLR